MKFKILLLLSVFSVLFSCSGSKAIVATSAQKEQLSEMITDNKFMITSDWAKPAVTSALVQVSNSGILPPGSTISNINLIGNSNYLKMHKDSVEIALPYFGERQMSNGYNSDSGINFSGVYNNYKTNYIADKNYHSIVFDVKNKMESLNFRIRLYDNSTSNIIINSSHRSTISYTGTISKYDNNKE